ncbi:MAG: Stp1/IreP family PP2C-type Ser/Thr phosphatase [Peptoniphilaceae bacterium]
MMKFIAATNKGSVRENNEDSYNIDYKNRKYFLLADGMGGHKAGEIASSIAVEEIGKFLEKEVENEEELISLIKDSIYEVNKKIFSLAKENLKYRGMGTTLSLIYIYNNEIYYASIGDSRIYEISKNNINQITMDDSFINYLIQMGEISKEEAKNHPKRNVLTKALGTSESIDVEVKKLSLNKGYRYLICSDGLTNMVKDQKIYEILEKKEIEDGANKLIQEALLNGGIDNITLIIIDNK